MQESSDRSSTTSSSATVVAAVATFCDKDPIAVAARARGDGGQVLISPTFYKQLFLLIFWCQKITKPNCNYRKAAQFAFVRKMRVQNVDEIDSSC